MGNYKIFFFFFVLAIFLFLPKVAFAQVVINEFSSSSNPEWVELYNLGSTPVSLEGWTLFFQDNPETNQRVIFSTNDIISGDGYKLVEHSYTGTQAWLRNDGDTIILKDPNGEVDSVKYGDVQGALVSAPDSEHSAGRSPNGTGEWVILDSATPDAANSPPVPTPTLTPTPTPTLGSTSTPTPKLPTSTPTPKPPTSTPTPTKKPTPTLKPSPTSTPAGEILGEEESATNAFYPLEATEEAESTSQSGSSFKTRWLPKILLGVGFLLLFGAAFWVWYTKLRWPEQESS